MHGVSTSYRMDPSSEYVFGVIDRRGLHVTRGRRHYVLHAGDLAAYDPSNPHSGAPLDGGPWEYRLLVVELADVAAAAGDAGTMGPDVEFVDPVIDDPRLAVRFRRLHAAMEAPTSTLARQTLLATVLQDIVDHSPVTKARRSRVSRARRDPAVRLACEYIRDNLTSNVGLDDVASVAGTSKFRLVRLFRTALGVPPHTFQIGQRVQRARHLLEHGVSPADAAVRCGFHDQSHLHRHFTPRLGLTPARYARAAQHHPPDSG
jgi:AraC-like DNA-binding protein